MKIGAVEEQVSRMRGAFDSYNVHRIYRATSNFSDDDRSIFASIPLMLHYNFMRIDGLRCPPLSPCGIDSFTPRELHMQGFKALFGNAKLLGSSDKPIIKTLALVGSLGTVGQTGKSDFDYVVIIDKGSVTDRKLIDLHEKLSSIEKYLMEKFSAEVHFFTQDMDDFRRNRFGRLDKENIGTAMGQLFKDEFYRTAIFAAGKRPLWWILPPGMPRDEENNFMKLAASIPDLKMSEYIDLGHVVSPDPQEFFGAALWQMNKSIHSPFKSVLKMGLMEAYLFEQEKGLLCDEIKKELLQSPDKRGEIDPYLKMFERTVNYYESQNMEKEVHLLRASFLMKLGIDVEKGLDLLTLAKDRLTEREGLISDIMKKWGIARKEIEAMGRDFISYEGRYQDLGEMNRFFLDVYVRLSDWLKSSKLKERRISDKDMTILGRKLFTYFEHRQGKVPFIYPGNAPKNPPAALSLTNNVAPSGEKYWVLFDSLIQDLGSRKYEAFEEPIARFGTIMEMITWMVINKIWTPDSRLRFFSTMHVYKSGDVLEILKGMYGFFMEAGQVEPTREDYLSDAAIIKVFAVPNLGMGHKPGEITRVDMVLLNSWGEYDCTRKKRQKAYVETANFMKRAKMSGKPFSLKAVAPPSQKDPGLAQEFEYGIDNISADELNGKKSRKTKLDLL
ncbi:MAG: class I adenylate cyclase [Nitrospinota bacterium]